MGRIKPVDLTQPVTSGQIGLRIFRPGLGIDPTHGVGYHFLSDPGQPVNPSILQLVPSTRQPVNLLTHQPVNPSTNPINLSTVNSVILSTRVQFSISGETSRNSQIVYITHPANSFPHSSFKPATQHGVVKIVFYLLHFNIHYTVYSLLWISCMN